MRSVQAATSGMLENAHVLHCLLCRRVRWVCGEQGGSTEWEELTGFLTHHRLALSSLVTVDAYCETCETFYRQLLTYGQPGQANAGSTVAGQITA